MYSTHKRQMLTAGNAEYDVDVVSDGGGEIGIVALKEDVDGHEDLV